MAIVIVVAIILCSCDASNGLPAGRWYEYSGVRARSIDGGKTFLDLRIEFGDLPKGLRAKVVSMDGQLEVDADDLREDELKQQGFEGPTLTSGENMYEYINTGCTFHVRHHVPITMFMHDESKYVCVVTVRNKEHVLRPGITPAQVEAAVGKLRRKH